MASKGPSASKPCSVREGGVTKKTAYLRPGQLAKFAHSQRAGTLACLRAGIGGGSKRVKAHELDHKRPPLPSTANALMPSKTLNKIFSHKSKKKALKSTGRQKDCPLLSLPQEVLARIVCFLRHDELQPLYSVCTRLRDAAAAATVVHFNYVTPDRDLGPESQLTPSNAARLAAQQILREKAEANNIPRAPFRMRRRRRSRTSHPHHTCSSNVFDNPIHADNSNSHRTPLPARAPGEQDVVHSKKPPPIQRKPPNPNRVSLAGTPHRGELESSVRTLAFSPGCHSSN
mmetsp:Transcript_305/g.1021  ORF Transcript_305/g.1021 Transcript_305/m.1021 type:complete len:287 (-) Transcript_305:49-909(-)